jgi:prepilin-type N-terminal cleavage/methylation domain-containing protein
MLRRALNSPAFTLVELMVVLIILTILIAVILPALSRARQQSIAVKLAAERSPAMRRRPSRRRAPRCRWQR